MKQTINLTLFTAFLFVITGCQPTGESMCDLLDSTVNENGVRECCPHSPGCNLSSYSPTSTISSEDNNPFSRMRD